MISFVTEQPTTISSWVSVVFSMADEDSEMQESDVKVESEYWTDYNTAHHGIIYCWRNNFQHILLGVEESIAPHKDAYELIILDENGNFIANINDYESEEDAVRQALELQQSYPKGKIPEYIEKTDDVDKSVTDEPEETEQPTHTEESLSLRQRILKRLT